MTCLINNSRLLTLGRPRSKKPTCRTSDGLKKSQWCSSYKGGRAGYARKCVLRQNQNKGVVQDLSPASKKSRRTILARDFYANFASTADLTLFDEYAESDLAKVRWHLPLHLGGTDATHVCVIRSTQSRL